MNKIRLLPLIMLAAGSLLILRGMSIVTDGRLNAFGTSSVVAQETTQNLSDESAQATETSTNEVDAEIAAEVGTTEKNSGTVAEVNMQLTPKAAKADDAASKNFTEEEIQALQRSGMSQNEINLLLRLRDRREQLATKERQLELRENMLRKVETSLETKLEAFGANSESPLGQLDENGQLIQDNSQMEQLAAMYEAMKPKDAARIMSRLSTPLLREIASNVKPRKMSAIMAKMSGDAAERLTLAMANNARNSNVAELPQVGANGISQ